MLKLRSLTPADCDWLFELSNEETARQFSYNTDPIKYEDHIVWFQKQIGNLDSLIFVFESEGEKVGIVRFTNEKTNWLVGINIHKDFRGKGLGSHMLAMAIETLKPEIPIFAYIKRNNEASIKTFAAAHFTCENKLNIKSIPSYLYIWK
jgi:UDP-2,4-diacetamido-2,4,6-trideoxy-beta-L-altropyranose hydrolase